MISVNKQRGYGKVFNDVRCLSTDTKPTDVKNGSTCIEIDSGKKFLFDGDSKTWSEMPGDAMIGANGVSF